MSDRKIESNEKIDAGVHWLEKHSGFIWERKKKTLLLKEKYLKMSLILKTSIVQIFVTQ